MTLAASGAISIGGMATELGLALSNVSLNDTKPRYLTGKSTGVISLSDAYAKSRFIVTSAPFGYQNNGGALVGDCQPRSDTRVIVSYCESNDANQTNCRFAIQGTFTQTYVKSFYFMGTVFDPANATFQASGGYSNWTFASGPAFTSGTAELYINL